MRDNAKPKDRQRKQFTGSLGEMLKDNSMESIVKLILDLNIAVVKGSEAERKINSYLPFISK